MEDIRQTEEAKRYVASLQEAGFCGDLENLVWGEGPLHAAIFLLGEAPGAQEALAGRPFVGKAGQQLNDFLAEIELDRSALYLTNAVKYRPIKPGRNANRTPSVREIDMGREVLLLQIEQVAPKLVVTLGNSALYAVLQDRTLRIGDVHGHLIDGRVAPVFPLYHPASVIYNRSLRETYQADMQRLKAYLQESVDG